MSKTYLFFPQIEFLFRRQGREDEKVVMATRFAVVAQIQTRNYK